jgi:hypothetical protein
MRALSRIAVALLLVLVGVSPVFAGAAVIETTAPLSEHSNESIKTAVVTAVETAARGAKAMGLSRIALNDVRVLPSMVIVQVLATDMSSESGPNAPGSGPDDEDLSAPDKPDGDIQTLGSGEASGLHVLKR